MNPKNYAVYRIEISDLNPLAQGAVATVLAKHGALTQYQYRPNDTAIIVPRLCTFWRGDDQEAAWQKEVRAAVKKATEGNGIVTIHAEPWSLLDGYPKGELP